MADRPVYRLRFNGAAAAVAITLIVCVFATWLALVLTHTIKVETIYPFLSHLAVFVFATFLPGVFSLWKEKRLIFDVTSDPPSGGEEKKDGPAT